MDYFLEILGSHTDKYEEPLFQELYSWYLRSPEYQELTKKLTDAAFMRKPADRISASVARLFTGRYRRTAPPDWSALQPVPLPIF